MNLYPHENKPAGCQDTTLPESDIPQFDKYLDNLVDVA